MSACRLCGGELTPSRHPIRELARRGYTYRCRACGAYCKPPRLEFLRPGFLTLDEQGQAEQEEAMAYGFRTRRQLDTAFDNGEV